MAETVTLREHSGLAFIAAEGFSKNGKSLRFMAILAAYEPCGGEYKVWE